MVTDNELTYKKLTPAQLSAVNQWWEENDPDQTSYECVDNTRYAVKGDMAQEEAYEHVYNQGCCGFRDVELVVREADGSSHVLMFGFNYGH